MKTKKLINEVKLGIYKIRFFNAFLGSSVIFLTTYLILMLLNLPTLAISLTIATLFFITEIVIMSKTGPFLEVEKKYSVLFEKLRTVKDTIKMDNELINQLRDEVKKNIKKVVDIGDFIDFRKVLSRVLFIFFVSFLIILIASLNIKLLDAEDLIDRSQGLIQDFNNKITKEREKLQVVNSQNELQMHFKKLALTAGIGGGDTEGEDIFGNIEIIQLGNEKINIEISPTDFEVSVDNFNPPERRNFLDKPYEDDVFSDNSFGFEENIPQKRQEIVKRYFKKLAEN